MWLEHGGLFAGPCGRLGVCFVPTVLVEAAVLWDVDKNKEWLWWLGTTSLTSSPTRMAVSEKTLGSLDVTKDFVNPRPWDPWFGGLQGRADKAAFHGDEGWNRILGCGSVGWKE